MATFALGQAQFGADFPRKLGRDQSMGGLQPVLDLGGVQRGQIIELHPSGAGQIRGRDRSAGFGQHLEGDVADLERNPALGHRVSHHREHPAAHLIDLIGTPRSVQGYGRQTKAGDMEGLWPQASTPTPMGQVTPVPPMPQ